MRKYVWCHDRADLYLGVFTVRHISEEKDYIKFKGCIAYRKGKLKDCVLELKNYKMPLSKFRKLHKMKDDNE